MKRRRPLAREILTSDEVASLLEQCGETVAGLRNRALIMLLDGTGLRISEALALEPRDLDWDEGLVNVRHGKGDKQRVVPVARRTLDAVQDWMRARSYVGIRPDAPVCSNLGGTHLSDSYVRKRLHQLAANAGIAKRTHPHGLRHRFATRLVRRGVVITSVSQVLGHSNLAVTHRYCARLGAGPALDDVRKALRALDRGRGHALLMKVGRS